MLTQTLLVVAALGQDLAYSTRGEEREVELDSGTIRITPLAGQSGSTTSFGVHLEADHRRDIDRYGSTFFVESGGVRVTADEFTRVVAAAKACADGGVARLEAMPFKKGYCSFEGKRLSFHMDPDDFELFLHIPCETRIFVSQLLGPYSSEAMRTATKSYVDPAGDMILFITRSNFEQLTIAMDQVATDINAAGAP